MLPPSSEKSVMEADKLRKINLSALAANIRKIKNAYNILVEKSGNLKERAYVEDPGIDERIILK